MPNLFTSGINSARVAGSLFGAGTSLAFTDFEDSPFISTAQLGVGAYTGFTVANSFAREMSTVNPLNRITNAYIDVSKFQIDTFATEKARALGRLDNLTSNIMAGALWSEYQIGGAQRRMKLNSMYIEQVAINNLNKLTGFDVSKDYQGIAGLRNAVLNDAFDESKLKAITTALSSRYAYGVSEVPLSLMQSADPGISIRGNRQHIESSLKSALINQFSNPEDVASRKAAGLAAALEGRQLTIRDGGLLVGSPDSPEFKIPLTSHLKQSKFTVRISAGDGFNYIAKPFNPYAHSYLTGHKVGGIDIYDKNNARVAREAMAQALDPEEWISVLSKAHGGKLSSSQIELALGETSKLMQFVERDSYRMPGEAYSSTAIGVSNSISAKYTLQERDGNIFIRQLSGVSRKSGEMSEVARLFHTLTNAFGSSVVHGNSLNDVYSFSAREYAPLVFNPLPAHEYNEVAMGLRDVDLVSSSESKMLQMMGKGELLRDQQIGGRLNISGKSEKLFEYLFGSDYALGEGQGIMSDRATHKVITKQIVARELVGETDGLSMKITSTLNQKLFTEEFLGLSQENRMKLLKGIPVNGLNPEDFGIQRGIADSKNELFARNGLWIRGAQDSLGLGQNGIPETLGSQFTSGRIIDIVPSEKGVKLKIQAYNKPKGWVKLFGVNAKAGNLLVDDDIFRKMSLISTLEQTGRISIDDETSGRGARINILDKSLKGGRGRPKSYSASAFLSSSVFQNLMTQNADYLDSIEMIGRLDEAKWGDLGKILSGTSDNLDLSGYRGQGWDDVVDIIERNRSSDDILDRAKAANAMRALMLTSEDVRSRQSMLATIGEAAAGDKQMWDKFQRLMNVMESSSENLLRQKQDITDLIRFAYDESDRDKIKMQFREQVMYTPEVGIGIHGAGKAGGSISFLEQTNILASGQLIGASEEDMRGLINILGQRDAGAIYELEMIRRGGTAGQFGINDIDPSQRNNVGKVISEAFNMSPEKRGEYLSQKLGIKVEGNMLTYNLSRDIDGLKSVAIPLMQTQYSGLSEFGTEGARVTELDKMRRSLILEDIQMNLMGSGDEGLRSTANKYQALVKSRITGTENIIKAAMKMKANNGMMGVATAVGGRAAEVLGQDSVAISLQDAIRMYNDAGLDISQHMKKVAGTDLYELSVLTDQGNKQMYGQWAREPVQGPISSIPMKIYAKANSTAGHMYMSNEGEMLKHFASLDFDADSPRLALFSGSRGQGIKASQHAMIADLNTSLVSMATSELNAEIQREMSAKNSVKKSGFMQGGMASTINALAAKLKGQERKHLAPEVTKFNTVMNTFISETVKDRDESFRARSMLYSITESLLKTSHKDTSTFLQTQGAAVTIMDEAVRNYIGGKGASKISEKQFRNIMDTQLENLVGGGNLSDGARKEFNTVKGTIINALSENAYRYFDQEASPLLSRGSNRLSTMSDIVDFIGGAIFSRNSGSKLSLETSYLGGQQKRTVNVSKLYNDSKAGIMSAVSKNKKPLIVGGLALSALGFVSAGTSSDIDPSAFSAASAEPLPPRQERKAFLARNTSDGKNVRVRSSTRSDMSKSERNNALNKSIFGNKVTDVNVNVKEGY